MEFYTGVTGRNKPISTRISLFNRVQSQRQLQRPQVAADDEIPPGPVAVQQQPPIQQHSSIPAGQVLLNHVNNVTPPPAPQAGGEMTPMNLAELFPCMNPVNPHMRSMEARLATFDVGWQSDRVRASPQLLADSGMYYLGERDRVKCWYCNGGLQNWEYEDEPWFEHAKWFPQCEYLLQKKGPTFVHEVVARFPNIRRPPIRNPTQRQVVSGLNQANTGPRRRHIGARGGGQPQRPEAPPQIIDPRDEMRIIRRKVQEQMNDSPLVETAHQMGFERKLIKAAVKRKLEAENATFDRLESLIDSILSYGDDVPSDTNDSDNEMDASLSQEPSSMVTSPRDEIRLLEEGKKCKICKDAQIGIVFLPCGHLASCVECAKSAKYCPICKVAISQTVRVFPS